MTFALGIHQHSSSGIITPSSVTQTTAIFHNGVILHHQCRAAKIVGLRLNRLRSLDFNDSCNDNWQ
ncbi:hypothetical protein CVS40_1331 [Lucilia cuprina]|nr:hypothetical protein CVS40_1331 [Lucilia cuprina]